jgi:hypothetical protein
MPNRLRSDGDDGDDARALDLLVQSGLAPDEAHFAIATADAITAFAIEQFDEAAAPAPANLRPGVVGTLLAVKLALHHGDHELDEQRRGQYVDPDSPEYDEHMAPFLQNALAMLDGLALTPPEHEYLGDAGEQIAELEVSLQHARLDALQQASEALDPAERDQVPGPMRPAVMRAAYVIAFDRLDPRYKALR